MKSDILKNNYNYYQATFILAINELYGTIRHADVTREHILSLNPNELVEAIIKHYNTFSSHAKPLATEVLGILCTEEDLQKP